MPLPPGQRRLYRGEYNYMHQDWQPAGSCWVTIDGGSHPQGYRMHIQNLWGPNETVLFEEVGGTPTPGWMQARLAQASGGPP